MLRYYLALAVRGLRRTPWMAMLMTGTIAVGLAAGMVTMTLRHVLGVDPIPTKSARLLSITDANGPEHTGAAMFSYGEGRQLREVAGALATPVLSGEGIITSLVVGGTRHSFGGGIGIRYTEPEFFHVFSVSLRAGRVWTPREQEDAAPVIVIAEGLADELFPGRAAVGQRIGIGSAVFTVVGVAKSWNPQPRYYELNGPAGAFGGGGDAIFAPVTAIQYAPVDLMVPLACPGRSMTIPNPSGLLESPCKWLSVWYLVHRQADAGRLGSAVAGMLSKLLPRALSARLALRNVRELL